MKRLLIILLTIEFALIALLAVGLLGEQDSYGRSHAAYRNDRSAEAEHAWDAEQLTRDRQVLMAFGGIAALCVNSCALCFVFGRVMGEPTTTRRRTGTLTPAAKRSVRLAQSLLVVSIALIAVGAYIFAQCLKNPSPIGLWALVAVMIGGVSVFGAILWWALARRPDQALPVDEGSDQ